MIVVEKIAVKLLDNPTYIRGLVGIQNVYTSRKIRWSGKGIIIGNRLISKG